MDSFFGNGNYEEKLLLVKIDKRMSYLYKHGFMLAAGALDPETHYKYGAIATHVEYGKAVTLALRKVAANSVEATTAIHQFLHYRNKRGMFDSKEARLASGTFSAGDWWEGFGVDCPELQRLAKRIVSQCVSSSGCERNWSTFALVHTKVRNRLGYEKLHKLVFVHYNLKLRLLHFEAEMGQRENESDPVGVLMDVALYDEGNPIMEWLSNSRSQTAPELDPLEIAEEIDRFEQE